MHPAIILPEPVIQFVAHGMAPGNDQRHPHQIGRRYRFFFCQRRVTAHQNAPLFPQRHPYKIKPADLHRFQQQPEIQRTVLQFFLHVVRIGRVDMKHHLRIVLPEGCHQAGQAFHVPGFTAADANGTCHRFPVQDNFLFRFFRQLQNFLRPPPQQPAFFRKRNADAVAPEQANSQFLFQLHHLPGQRRLGNVQLFRRTGDVLFPCNCKKILQYTDFHNIFRFPNCFLS